MKPFVFENINTSIPLWTKTSKRWGVDMNNATGADSEFLVYAVCGGQAGWKVITGAAVTDPANSQTFAQANCPSPELAVGGGEFSNSTAPRSTSTPR